MDDPYAVDRRGFLKTGAVAAAATTVACGKADSRWRALTDAEAATLAAACDRIIPPDQDPGASQAGGGQLHRPPARDALRRRQLPLLACRARRSRRDGAAGATGSPSRSCRRTRRPRCCRTTEQGAGEKADWGGVDPGEFFDRLRTFTMMGFYGDPRHGGNKDRVALADDRRARPAGPRPAARDAAAAGARAAAQGVRACTRRPTVTAPRKGVAPWPSPRWTRS